MGGIPAGGAPRRMRSGLHPRRFCIPDGGDATAIDLLGGFTTFSGLAADVWWAWHEGARGSLALYLLASLVGGGLALVVGLAIARTWGA